jgi:hypothetical protein
MSFLLRPLVSSTKKEENHHLSEPGEIDAVSRPPVDPELQHAFAHRPGVAKVANCDAGDARLDARARRSLFQALQPFDQWLLAGRGLVKAELDGHRNL